MSFYDQASLQDILAQGQGGMGMGQAVQSIPPSPYNQMAQTDPGFVNRITQRMQSLIEPTMDPRSQQLPDQAYGRASSHERGNQGIPDDETSAWETATAILKTPFAVLNTVRDGLQDTLGFGGAQYRQAQRDNVEALQNLPQRQREALGIDRISGIQTPGMAAGETSGTAGAPSSLGSNAGSTMKGYVEWANNMGRDRAQQTMNQVRATINAQYAAGKMTKLELENLNEVLSGVRTNADTNRIYAETEGRQEATRWIAPQARANINQSNAAAGASHASAYNQTAQGDTVVALRPELVGKAKADAEKARADSQGQYDTNWRNMDSYLGIGVPEGQLKIDKMIEENDQLRRAGKFIEAEHTVKLNEGLTNIDKNRGVFSSGTAGVASGSQGVGGIGGKDSATAFDQRMRALEYQRKHELTPQQMNDELGVPLIEEPGRFYGTNDVLDWNNFDPSGGARWLESLGGKSATQQPTPLLPMPGVDPAPSTPSAVRPSGDTIYAITQILRKANPAGSAGDQVQRAQEIAKVYESLDRSSPDAFVASAKSANLSNDEIRALWQAGQGK